MLALEIVAYSFAFACFGLGAWGLTTAVETARIAYVSWRNY